MSKKHKKFHKKLSKQALLAEALRQSRHYTGASAEVAQPLPQVEERRAQLQPEPAVTAAAHPHADSLSERFSPITVRQDIIRVGWTTTVIAALFTVAYFADRGTDLFERSAQFLFNLFHLS